MTHMRIASRTTVILLEAAAILCGGSETKLARATGYSQNAIWSAKRSGRTSAEMAIRIDRATGGAIPKEKLRPDLPWCEKSTALDNPTSDDTSAHAVGSSPDPTPDIAESQRPSGRQQRAIAREAEG
jgi:DNA-binding transcriptional regulator YdaS (Cro superfamily)